MVELCIIRSGGKLKKSMLGVVTFRVVEVFLVLLAIVFVYYELEQLFPRYSISTLARS
jgi:hypothetical protein